MRKVVVLILLSVWGVSCDFDSNSNSNNSVNGELSVQTISEAMKSKEDNVLFSGNAPYNQFMINMNQSMTGMCQEALSHLTEIHGEGNAREAFSLTRKGKSFFIVKNEKGYSRLIFVDYNNRIIKDIDESPDGDGMSLFQAFDYLKIFNEGKHLIVVGRNRGDGLSSMNEIVCEYDVDNDQLSRIVTCLSATVEDDRIVANVYSGVADFEIENAETKKVVYQLRTDGDQLVVEKEGDNLILETSSNASSSLTSATIIGLIGYVPNHSIAPNCKRYMTEEYYQALIEAWEVPSDGLCGIGSEEWLYYFIDGNSGATQFFVQIDGIERYAEKSIVHFSILRSFEDVEYEQPRFYLVDRLPSDKTIDKHVLTLSYSGEYNRWVISDYDNTLKELKDYKRKQIAYFSSSEWQDDCKRSVNNLGCLEEDLYLYTQPVIEYLNKEKIR